jgi:hypothetical protein
MINYAALWNYPLIVAIHCIGNLPRQTDPGSGKTPATNRLIHQNAIFRLPLRLTKVIFSPEEPDWPRHGRIRISVMIPVKGVSSDHACKAEISPEALQIKTLP